jgi:hypothetical protein
VDEDVRIGMTVNASDGEAGVVEDILVDGQGVQRYLVVRDRGVFGADVVLPIGSATASGETVAVAMARSAVHAADRFSADRYGEAAGLFSMAAARYDRQAE